MILLFILLFSAGAMRLKQVAENGNSDHFSKADGAEFLKINIVSEPVTQGKNLRFRARVSYAFRQAERHRCSGTVLVSVRPDSLSPHTFGYGDTYLVPASYQQVNAAVHPADFDYRFWLSNQQIYHQLYLSASAFLPAGYQEENRLVAFAIRLRQRQVAYYRELIPDDAAFAVAATLILGYRSELDQETLSAYSATGTIHALSVSGMHVGIVYLVLEYALRVFNRHRILRLIKLVLTLGLIWFYTLLTGYSPSVLRSALMLSLFVLSKGSGRVTDSSQVLFLSAFVLLLADPFLLWDIGFQLSYLAVSGLIWLQPRLLALYTFRWTWLQRLWTMITVSVAAQTMTFPLSVYYFHQFPVYFVLSNLFIALPVTILMYMGILILLFRLSWLGPVFGYLISFMNSGLAKIAALPYSSPGGIWFSRTALLLLSACMIFAALFPLSRRMAHLSLAALIAFLGLRAGQAISCRQQRQIILFPLNTGYAAAFIKGTTAVVITGGSASGPSFRLHIRPELDRRRVRKIICLPWKTPYSGNGLTIKGQQLQFYRYRVLLADTVLDRQQLSGMPRFNAVWLHGPARIRPEALRNMAVFDRLWIDSSSPEYIATQYRKAYLPQRIPVVALRNKGTTAPDDLVIDLNR